MAIVSCIEAINRAMSAAGAVTEYSSPELNAALAQGEKRMVEMRIMQAGGTSPTITVKLERSNDNLTWDTTAQATFFSNASLANGTSFAQDTGANVGGCFARLSVTLGGTNPTAHIQIIVTARED